MGHQMHRTFIGACIISPQPDSVASILRANSKMQLFTWPAACRAINQSQPGCEIADHVAVGIRLKLTTSKYRAVALSLGQHFNRVEANIPEQRAESVDTWQEPVVDSFFGVRRVLDVGERVQYWLQAPDFIGKRRRCFFGRIDRCLEN